MSSSIAIRVENLGKRYRIGHLRKRHDTLRDLIASAFRRGDRQPSVTEDTIWALKDVSFEVNQGEVIGIIGRNGAGKSTLLKILSRITDPTEGFAEIHGRCSSLLEVGTGFHPELTGRENIYLNGSILGMKRAEIAGKFDEIVAFAEVEKFMDTPVKHYSSGMYVRLAFAVAAHLQPEILLVDEVLAVGDIEFQKKCIGKMESVAREGRTVLVVSHSMSTVKALCSKAVLLDGGRITSVGPVDSVVSTYCGWVSVASATKVITPEDHDSTGGRKIRVTRIQLLNSASNRFAVYWKQPISVLIDFTVFDRVEDISFAVSIRLLDGTFVFVSYNDDYGRPKWSFERGQHSVQVTIQNALKPGVYTLNTGAHQGSPHLNNTFNLDAAQIEVLGVSKEGHVAPPLNPGIMTGIESVFDLKT
ncbi:MAG: ABC transporter ATP-binding protein [Verrucomicrobia bacterium]|nr:ABC transporter ATP-binding protein [Verrucomicrobiota bacterium]